MASDLSITASRACFSGTLVWLSLAMMAAPALAATSGANGSHDPSRMIESNGKFYIFSTGGGGKSSTDGLVWADGARLFPSAIPASTTALVSNNEGVWAPDVIYLNNQYYIYYAIANSSNACAVGLVTTPTLDSTSANYKLTDRGVVVSNDGTATYCAIDPCPILDATGNLWLSWGSGYSKTATDNTIYVTRLDNTTGLVSSADSTKPGYPLEPGHIEGSYIYYHSGYYYLWWNSGGCCSSSTKPNSSISYELHVAQSKTITGPYTGARIFMQSSSGLYGPGQLGIYDQCGASRFTYHYYPTTGGSVVGENELTWGSDGWPVAGAESTTALTPCGQMGSGGSGAGGGQDAGSQVTGMDADAMSDSGTTSGESGSGNGSSGDQGTVVASSGSTGNSGGSGTASSSSGDASGGTSSGDSTAASSGDQTASGSGTTGSADISGAETSGSAQTGNVGAGGTSAGTANRSSGGGCNVQSGGNRGGLFSAFVFLGLALGAGTRRRRRLQLFAKSLADRRTESSDFSRRPTP